MTGLLSVIIYTTRLNAHVFWRICFVYMTIGPLSHCKWVIYRKRTKVVPFVISEADTHYIDFKFIKLTDWVLHTCKNNSYKNNSYKKLLLHHVCPLLVIVRGFTSITEFVMSRHVCDWLQLIASRNIVNYVWCSSHSAHTNTHGSVWKQPGMSQ